MHRGVIARWLGIGVASLVSAYLVAWGVSWLVGDRSGSLVTVDLGTGLRAVSYPGVLLGGLPPIADADSPWQQLLAAGAGVVGLAGAGIAAVIDIARRGRIAG